MIKLPPLPQPSNPAGTPLMYHLAALVSVAVRVLGLYSPFYEVILKPNSIPPLPLFKIKTRKFNCSPSYLLLQANARKVHFEGKIEKIENQVATLRLDVLLPEW